MSVTESGEPKKITASGTAQYIDFDYSVTGVVIKTTGDVYLAFDREATTDDFLLSSTDGVLVLQPMSCTKVSVISSGTPTVYVLGLR